MAEETEALETSEASTPDVTEVSTPSFNLDQKIRVGEEEFSASDLTEAFKNYNNLREYASELQDFQEATMTLMNPNTDANSKKESARRILKASNYSPEQIDEWVKIYDQEPEVAQTPNEHQPDPMAQSAYQSSQKANEDLMKLRAQILQQNMENSVSSALDQDADGKVLLEWIENTRQGEDLAKAKSNLAERVRAQALENLRQRRNAAGTFEDSWLGEEVQKAANRVAKDMLTVIGDTSKIGRVPETAGQTETLYRKDPVKLPNTKGKSFGDVEGQLRDWTTDQILRSLSDPGGDSKA